MPAEQYCQPAEQAKPCPCETGFACCEATQRCVPQTQSCGVPPDPEITHHPERGQRVPCAEVEIDELPDGTKSEVHWVFVADQWGNVTEMFGDRGNDTIIEYDSRWTYDIYGNLIQREEVEDGVVRFRRTLIYDSYGRLTTQETDRDGDGVIDQRDTWEYWGQQPVRKTRLYEGVGIVSALRCTYTMQNNGFPASYACMTDPTGARAESARYTQTADKRTIQFASDGVHVDREIDITQAATVLVIEDYTIPPGLLKQLQRRFLIGPTGIPKAWELFDHTRPDLPHSTGTYAYNCQ